MNRRILSAFALVAAIILLGLSVYYLVPGIAHSLTFSGLATDAHPKHAALFAAQAVLCVLGGLVSRRRAATTG